jgi:hypothetical protein
MTDVQPNFKAPKRKKVSGVRVQKAGTAAALKRRATKLWGEYVHQRDRVCQFCGKADGKLDAHHIMLRRFAATVTDERNGLLLCFRCHQDTAHGDAYEAFLLYRKVLGETEYAELRQRAYDGVGRKYGVDYWRGEVARLERLLGYLERLLGYQP